MRRFADDLRLALEDFFKAAHGRAPALDQGQHPAEGRGGPRQYVQVGDKRDDVGDQQIAAQHAHAAVPDNDQHGQTVDALHDRIDDAAHLRHLHALDFVVLVEPDELLRLEVFLRVRLDDVHAAQIFLDMAAQHRHLLLDLERAFEDPAAKCTRDVHQQRKRREGGQRHAHVHRQHQSHRVDVVERRIGEVEDSRTEHHAHGGNVVDHPRHKIAGPLRMVESRRQFLQMGKKIVAQIVFNIAAGIENQRPRVRAHHALHNRGGDNQHGIVGHVPYGTAMFDDPHRLANPPRNPHDEGRRAEQAESAEQILPAVTPQISPQSPHESW